MAGFEDDHADRLAGEQHRDEDFQQFELRPPQDEGDDLARCFVFDPGAGRRPVFEIVMDALAVEEVAALVER